MVNKIICKPIKKFANFEVWNDGTLRIRQKAKEENEDDTLIVFFPCDIDNIKAALEFQDSVFSEQEDMTCEKILMCMNNDCQYGSKENKRCIYSEDLE